MQLPFHYFQITTFLLSALGGFALLIALLALFGRIPIRYNVRNLIVRWKITILTPVVFSLVVGLLVALCAFVRGMFKLTEGSSHPGNVIVLADGSTDEMFSNLSYSDLNRIEAEPYIERDDASQPLVSWEAYMVVNQPIPNAPPTGRQRRFIQVRGVDDSLQSGKVHGLTLAAGQWLSDAGGQPLEGDPAVTQIFPIADAIATQGLALASVGTAPSPQAVAACWCAKQEPSKLAILRRDTAWQVVLGQGIARDLGNDADKGKTGLEVGDTFELGPRKCIVVGVMQSAGSTFDSEVWAKRSLVGEEFGKKSPTTLVVRTKEPDKAGETATYITEHFTSPAVKAQTESEYYDKLNGTNIQFLAAVGVVSIFLALGGMAGIMITMFAAISSRVKDISVLRILGFARWQVLVSFFLESLLLALVGGLIGCAVGSLAHGWSTTSLIGSGQGGGKTVVFTVIVDQTILLGGVFFALLMGAIGGLIPAFSAMATRPLESLR
jgi:predicted lysophospholipase L1 biosynthesis ABC-type transport system permease subunit